jgi:hypothetical protein
MEALQINFPMALDRVSGLLAWWGIPNITEASEIEARAKRFHVLFDDLRKLFGEASSSQAQALSAANELFARSVHELLSAPPPPERIAAQSRLVAGFTESLAAQTKDWAELTQKVHGCCAVMVCESTEETAQQAGGTLPAATQGQSERPAGKETGKRAAKT